LPVWFKLAQEDMHMRRSESVFYRPRSRYRAILIAFSILAAVTARATVAAEPAKPIELASRLELLLDDYLIDSMENLQFQLHSPRPAERVLVFDKPWENGPFCDYVTVFKDGDRYRMYYACHLDAPKYYGGPNQITCHAESTDAIHWTKPSLKVVELGGSLENNIVWKGEASHNFTPFLDTRPGVPADQKYKAVGGNPRPFLFASADGIRWRQLGEAAVEGKFDSQNLIYWDELQKQYVFYYRVFEQGHRHIARSTSGDFVTWTQGQSIDLGNSPREHLYTNATVSYFRAPHLYLAFPMRFVQSRPALVDVPRPGVCDAVFMFSRDGVRFSRRYMEAFLRPGPNPRSWTKHSVMIAWGILPTANDEISLYVSQHHLTDSNQVIRAVLRTDGFVSIRGPYAGGQFVTKPITFTGNRLVINAETSAVGRIRVEVQDAAGKPVDGHQLGDCTEFYGDTVAHTVQWKGGGDLAPLAGKTLRLRVQIQDADLYSIRFSEGL
jgi:hypothetical protein